MTDLPYWEFPQASPFPLYLLEVQRVFLSTDRPPYSFHSLMASSFSHIFSPFDECFFCFHQVQLLTFCLDVRLRSCSSCALLPP